MKKLTALGLAVLLIAGCGDDPDGDGDPTGGFDQALLARYRAALPGKAELTAPVAAVPVSTMAPEALGDPAVYPNASKDVILGVNGAITAMLDLLELVTSIPPTAYDAQTQEFFWGPFEHDDGFGWTGAYIRDAGDGADFRYQYAFLRSPTADVAGMTPVIWGGANPDPEVEDHGNGITLWDFEANHAFEMTHDPAYDAEAPHDRGRFVAVYGKGPAEDDAEATVAIVYAVFRDFVPKDDPDAEPADLDYLWGHFEKDAFGISFLDFEFQSADGYPGAAKEDIGIRMAFGTDLVGRAEVDVTGGGTESGSALEAVECWDAAVEQTYWNVQVVTASGSTPYQSEGTEASCGGIFQNTLDELNVPTLQSIDPALMDALDGVATNGVPG